MYTSQGKLVSFLRYSEHIAESDTKMLYVVGKKRRARMYTSHRKGKKIRARMYTSHRRGKKNRARIVGSRFFTLNLSYTKLDYCTV